MYITNHGPNQTSVTTKDFTVFFSYDTPVVLVKHGTPQHVLVTSTKHSRTTSKHINQFKATLCDSSKISNESQTQLENLVSTI